MIALADPAATLAAGAAIGAQLRVGDLVCLSGPLGAGKTLLARGMIAALGHAGDVPSPSFPIVIPYDPPAVRLPVWHVDLYRLDDPDDARELGLNDARGDGALIVEWPDRLGLDRDPEALLIAIAMMGDARGLTVRVPPSWEARWPLR